MNASKFEEISKSSGVSSIASFFVKKEEKDDDIQEKKNLQNTDEMKSLANSDNNTAIMDNLEPTEFSYARDEIDQSIMKELPDDIKNEIQQFVGVTKTPEQTKRTSNGIEKYTVCRKNDETKMTESNEIIGNTTDELKCTSATEDSNSKSAGFSNCSKCGQEIAESKMEEHNDFHFAMELQKEGEMTFKSYQSTEPPKKRQKGTISKFFVTKGK